MKKNNEEKLIKYLRSLILRSMSAIVIFLILAILSKSSITYNKLNNVGIISELKNDYEDMHGMSTYSLNEYIGKRLSGGSI